MLNRLRDTVLTSLLEKQSFVTIFYEMLQQHLPLSIHIIHTSVPLTLCFTLLTIPCNFLRGFFQARNFTIFFFFFKRNIRGFKINEFEVESLLMDIHIFIIQLIISIYRIICFFSSTISPRIFNFRYLPMKTFTNFPYI